MRLPEAERPDPRSCIASAGIPATGAGAGEAEVVESLFAAAREQAAGSRFESAQGLLDCADAVLGMAPEPATLHALVRQRGALEYRRDRLPQALARLECALSLSRASEDREAVARDLNAVGSALRRLGDYRGALAHLTQGLAIARQAEVPDAALLNNLGDVYRDLQDPDKALDHYAQAKQRYVALGQPVNAAHVAESMAVAELEQGRVAEAERTLAESLTVYEEAGRRDYALRVQGWLVRAALARGDVSAAERWRSAADAQSTSHALSLPLAVEVQAARSQRAAGDPQLAMSRLQRALQDATGNAAERAEAFEELAAAQEAQGKWLDALGSLRRAQQAERAFTLASHDRMLGWLRARFEAAERERTIDGLEAENQLREAMLQRRTLWLLLTVALALAGLLGLALGFQRRRQREGEAHAASLARKEAEVARYRREADALGEDRQRLQTLVDSRADALCLVDVDGRVLAANRAASDSFIDAPVGPRAAVLAELLGLTDATELHDALERVEDAAAVALVVERSERPSVRLRLSPWPEADGLVVVELQAREAAVADVSSAPSDRGVDGPAADGQREAFRRHLVELMLSAIDAWERGTGRTRLDLAEESRIWRVAVDDGRVRARSMERYLNLTRLPRNPRWRDVLRTAYHVLENCPLDEAARAALQGHVDAVLAYTRRQALV
jgi:tetratricopeptide (TPR) repeat protein